MIVDSSDVATETLSLGADPVPDFAAQVDAVLLLDLIHAVLNVRHHTLNVARNEVGCRERAPDAWLTLSSAVDRPALRRHPGQWMIGRHVVVDHDREIENAMRAAAIHTDRPFHWRRVIAHRESFTVGREHSSCSEPGCNECFA